METKARINWIALSAGFGLALVVAVPLLPSTRWVAVASYRQLKGEEDIWNIGPHRISGESDDAELARILILGNRETKSELVVEFIESAAPRADALAHWLRYSFVTVSRDESGQPNPSTEYIETVARYAQQGADLDPDNAYWPLVEAAHWVNADDFEAASEALRRAKDCTVYDDYTLDEGELVIAQLHQGKEKLTVVGEAGVMFGLSFPHASAFHNLAKRLPEDEIIARGDLALASVTVFNNASVPIMQLVSQSMARKAFLPNTTGWEQPGEQELREALDLLAQDRSEDLAALSAALKLATGIRPSPAIDDDQEIWDRAAEGHYLRWFVGGILWLAASTLIVFLGPWLARLGSFQWVARLAPFSGFLLMGWVALAIPNSATENLMLWDWHIPEIAVGGFLLGFVGLIERYTLLVRWAGLALSLFVLPLALGIPMLMLPLVAIWTTLILSGRKPDKWPTVITGALAPCLLTLPLAIMYGVDFVAGIVALFLVIAALALPLAWGSNVIAKKRQWAAVSIVLPCFFILLAIRMSLVADAAVGIVLENELQLVEQIRGALTP